MVEAVLLVEVVVVVAVVVAVDAIRQSVCIDVIGQGFLSQLSPMKVVGRRQWEVSSEWPDVIR